MLVGVDCIWNQIVTEFVERRTLQGREPYSPVTLGIVVELFVLLSMLTVINASAAVTLLEQRPEKIQALSRSEPEFFQVSVQVVLQPHLHEWPSAHNCY